MESIIPQDRILVTGAGGFIGANLLRRILPTGAKVHVLRKKSTNLSRIQDIQKKLTLHKVDLQDKKKLRTLCEKIQPTIIYHLAARGAYSNQTNTDEIMSTNIIGTFHLLEATKNIPYRLFVNTGTSSEYGFKKQPMKETDSLNPTSLYAATKASATHLCAFFAKEFRKPIVTLRPFSIYGPYEEPTRFIPTIISNLLNNKPILLTPQNIRHDFVFIDDMVEAYLKSVEHAKSLTGEVINVGTGKEYTNFEVVRMLFKITGKKVPVQKGSFPNRTWDSTHWVADTKKARKLLGLSTIPLEKGLLITYDWMKLPYEK